MGPELFIAGMIFGVVILLLGLWLGASVCESVYTDERKLLNRIHKLELREKNEK